MKIKNYIFIVALILLALCTYSFATVNTTQYTSISADDTFKDIAKPAIGALQIAASAIAIGCLAIMGMRFMVASPDQRADLKSSLVPYTVGAVMAFAMVPILSILYSIFAK